MIGKKTFFIGIVWLYSTGNFTNCWPDEMSPEVARNIEQLLATKRCIQCDLTGAKLNRVVLSGADLRGSRLNGATFFLADLANCNFQNSDLRGAQFGGAVLSGADFRGAKITGASYGGAYLKGAIFKREIQEERSPKGVLTNTKVTSLSTESRQKNYREGPFGSSAAPPVKKIQPINKVIVKQ